MLYNLGSGSWLAWASGTVAQCAAIQCRWQRTSGAAAQHDRHTTAPSAALGLHSVVRKLLGYLLTDPVGMTRWVGVGTVTGGGVGLVFDFVGIAVVGRVFHFTAVRDQLRSRSKAHRLRLLWCRLDSLVTNIRCRLGCRLLRRRSPAPWLRWLFADFLAADFFIILL